jgi:hypothetical protein
MKFDLGGRSGSWTDSVWNSIDVSTIIANHEEIIRGMKILVKELKINNNVEWISDYRNKCWKHAKRVKENQPPNRVLNCGPWGKKVC